MGMHTGEPTIRDGAYYGIDVHRAARIAQAGSGGQVLLSKRTRDELDSSHELEDLGDHELAGLGRAGAALSAQRPGPALGVPTAQHGAEEVFAACA